MPFEFTNNHHEAEKNLGASNNLILIMRQKRSYRRTLKHNSYWAEGKIRERREENKTVERRFVQNVSSFSLTEVIFW
jgi:hypothetical protein